MKISSYDFTNHIIDSDKDENSSTKFLSKTEINTTITFPVLETTGAAGVLFLNVYYLIGSINKNINRL